MKDIFESSGFQEEMSQLGDKVMQNLSDKEKDHLRKADLLVKYRNQSYLTKMKDINLNSYIELNVSVGI
jgi:hypothetical protein